MFPPYRTKAKNNVSPSKKIRSLKRLISFQKKKLSAYIVYMTKKTPLSPQNSQDSQFQSFLINPTSPMFMSQIQSNPNHIQICLIQQQTSINEQQGCLSQQQTSLKQKNMLILNLFQMNISKRTRTKNPLKQNSWWWLCFNKRRFSQNNGKL